MTRTLSMAGRRPWTVLYIVSSLGALGALGASCSGDPTPNGTPQPPSGPQCAASMNTNPEGDPWAPAADPADPVTASFEVTIDTAHAILADKERQVHPEPLTLTVKSGDFEIWGGVKRFVKHPERLYLELYFINKTKVGVRDATVSVGSIVGTSTFYDLNGSPWADATDQRSIPLGGIGPEGIQRIQIGFDAAADGTPITFQLDLSGVTTTRTSTTSSPIQVTPDGKEVWAVAGDGDRVAVIDTATDERVAQIEAIGRPSSVAITPDGKLVLVSCADCNQVSVIDRATRKITQIFGEAEGIGRDPKNIVLSPDGTTAYVSASVGDSVTALRRVGDAFRVEKEIPVGRRPLGLGVTPDGQTIYVSHFMPRGKIAENGAWVSILAGDTLEKVGEIELMDDGNEKEADCLRLIPLFSGATAKDLSFEATPTQLAGVFLTPGGEYAWIPGLRAAGFPIFEGDATGIGFQFLTKGANSPAMQFPMDIRNPRKADWMHVSSVIDVDDRSEDFLRCLPFRDQAEAVIGYPGPEANTVQSVGATITSISILLSESGVSRFTGYTRGGRRTLFLSYSADEIAVVDTATRSPTSVHHFTLKGSNPIGIATTPDGKKGYVAYENSTFVSALDLSAYADDAALPGPSLVPYWFESGAMAGQGAPLMTFGVLTRSTAGVPDLPPIQEIAQVPVLDADPMDPVLRRGKVLFTSSNPDKYPTLSSIREASCSACHPNGGNDGSGWSTMEGERRTMGLWGGLAGKGWLHASATHKDATDFARIIVKERLGGSGLSDEDVHALASYMARGIPEIQRPRVDEALAAKGKTIFDGRCKSCHGGEKYSSGGVDAANEYGGGGEALALYDVGSATDWANMGLGSFYANLFPPDAKKVINLLRGDRDLGAADEVQQILKFSARPERKRGSFKATSLVNVWENATFFHDCRADSLEEAVQDIAKRTGSELSPDELAAVVAYLKTL